MKSRRSHLTTAAVVLIAGALVVGCTNGKSDDGATKKSSTAGSASASSPNSPSAAPDPILSLRPANKSHDISPATAITASVANGKITAATLVNSAGKAVKGVVAGDGTSWKSAEELGYGKSYSLRVQAKNPDGKTVTKSSKFSTVAPSTFTMPYLQTIYNSGLTTGATYGVGMVISIHFDEPITNKAAAEKAISITSKPAVKGAFYWLSDEVVHWRPAHYWKTGTKVTVHANLYGVQVGSGLWGEQDKATHFTIGASHVAVADDKTYHVKVYTNGKLVRTMPTAMGLHMSIQGLHGPISLYTPQGTYTVMEHDHSVVMDSATFGLPHSSPYGYKETIYWATRISNGGVFLHELDTTVWAQGHQDISHGCLNLNKDNAVWFFNYSRVGDVVKVINTNGPALTVADGGDWTLSWAQWVKGGVNAN